MIGVYNYTVYLTYLSVCSSSVGVFSLLCGAHPVFGLIALLLSAICDAFDGKVARMKKDRTAFERSFGIQLDSLADVIGFGVLPATIGFALLKRSALYEHMAVRILCYALLAWYVLAALIRLAYFNVTEEERQETEGNQKRLYFIGIPVTLASFSFTLVMILDAFVAADLTVLYLANALVMSFGFVMNKRIPKPGLRGILCLIGIGVLEIAVLTVLHFVGVCELNFLF